MLNHFVCEQGVILIHILKTNRMLRGGVSLIRCTWCLLPLRLARDRGSAQQFAVLSVWWTISCCTHALVLMMVFKYHVKQTIHRHAVSTGCLCRPNMNSAYLPKYQGHARLYLSPGRYITLQCLFVCSTDCNEMQREHVPVLHKFVLNKHRPIYFILASHNILCVLYI
jgi:hypothetical protein